jgi:hypothetical protein
MWICLPLRGFSVVWLETLPLLDHSGIDGTRTLGVPLAPWRFSVSTKFVPVLAVSLLGFSGCAPFDGTWLFQWSLASVDTQSSCDIEESDVQYRGDQYQWIDIYTTSGGALVLTDGEQEYVGIASGSTFEVEATYAEQGSSTYYSWNDTITGSLNGKDLAGSRTLQEIDGDSDTECRTQTTSDYDGVKMLSDGSRASRTIGTQSSQSASTN